MTSQKKLCLLCAVASCVLIGTGDAVRLSADDAQPTKQFVRLVIDYGDGVQKHFTQLAWSDGTTVLSVLKVAQKHPRGIRFEYRGQGATAFLTKIDNLENQGGDRNWIYRVNDKFADKSFAVFTLKPGDTILWKLGEYR